MDQIDLLTELRRREDAAFAAVCKQMLADRAATILRRYEEDRELARQTYEEALALRSDAEGIHTAALSRADGIRGVLYRKAGYRGKRPDALVRLDDTEREARERLARYEQAANEAADLVRRFTPVGAAPAAAENLDPGIGES